MRHGRSAISRERKLATPATPLEEGRLDEVFRSITLPDTKTKRRTPVMRNILTIAKRELRGYFASPVAFVFIVIFLLLSGILHLHGRAVLQGWRGNLQAFFDWHPWLYLFLVPACGMRMWSEERRLGTIELLLRCHHAVAGHRREIPRSWAVVALALVLTFPVWITVNYLATRTMA
jgi:ABC-2 type transport system permease protein